jgi:hypothetical protein
LDYLAIKELDALVEARRSLQKRSSIVAPGRASTFSTFSRSNLYSHPRQTLPSKSVLGVEPELALLQPEQNVI